MDAGPCSGSLRPISDLRALTTGKQRNISAKTGSKLQLYREESKHGSTGRVTGVRHLSRDRNSQTSDTP